MGVQVLHGDCRDILATLPEQSVQCCVTSPPYYGLRDYGVDGQIGQEGTPDAYVSQMVAVFAAVRRVLRNDGTLWLNIGDSYAMSTKGAGGRGKQHTNHGSVMADRTWRIPTGLKPKDLLGIPWMLAFALRADGWFLRSDIIWHKPNPMPESVHDRPTSAHEHVFLLSKRANYFYDSGAIREEAAPGTAARYAYGFGGPKSRILKAGDKLTAIVGNREFVGGRNARNVWTVVPQPFRGAHFATMPPKLVERCIMAGSKPGDTILDPFGGAGTTGLVADRLGRDGILIELNPAYADLARGRLATAHAPAFVSNACVAAA